MGAAPPTPRPMWTRRVAAWSMLVFFVALIVLTYFAVYFSNRSDPVTTGYLAFLASVVPLLFVVVPYYATPIWAIGLPLNAEEIAQALARATSGLRAEPIAEREGLFLRCVSVVRFEEPACVVGWYPMTVDARAPRSVPRFTVVLRPRSRDRKALAAFRSTLALAFLEAAGSAA